MLQYLVSSVIALNRKIIMRSFKKSDEVIIQRFNPK
jgi:hypothetical protein